MAKNNPADVLSCDWNPVVGCNRYSKGCRNCWFMAEGGIFEQQQRVGNIPEGVNPTEKHVCDNRLSEKYLRSKKGIVGVVQHGDLFCDWNGEGALGATNGSYDEVIMSVLDIVDTVAAKRNDGTKYVLWTKRADRMATILKQRYTDMVPHHYGCAVSVEDQKTADERLPHLTSLFGTKILVIEPMLGPIVIANDHLKKLQWVIVGSETGEGAQLLELDWVRSIRDQAKAANKPFFVKQLGGCHKNPNRELDGVVWSEFPYGYVK